MTAILSTSDLRLSLISWKSELMSLAVKFPENFDAAIVERRLARIDAALLAIDGSVSVTLTPDAPLFSEETERNLEALCQRAGC
jgi:hypothetical protein